MVCLAFMLLTGQAHGFASEQILRAVAPSPHRLSSPVQMATVPMTKFDGSSAGEGEVDLKIAKSGAYLVHRKVVAEQANMRLGTACTKTRSEVRGGGRKPYQQKGTGRARRGSSRSPLLKGGGVTFGPKPKSFSIKMNKKEKQLAISTAIMSAIPKMTLVEDIDSYFTQPKTQDMRAFLERQSIDTKKREGTLLITNGRSENTALSARNIPYLNLMHMENINARDILKAKKVLVCSSALETIKTRYGAEQAA